MGQTANSTRGSGVATETPPLVHGAFAVAVTFMLRVTRDLNPALRVQVIELAAENDPAWRTAMSTL